MKTIGELLARGADASVAISAPGREGLTYAGLREQAAETARALRGFSVGRADAVAIVLDNGPEMATTFVSVAGAATAAPLNPAYTADEFDFYLGDLGAAVLIVTAGSDTPARGAAAARNIPVIELQVPDGAPAGRFTLIAPKGAGAEPSADPPAAGAEDTALVLHTSGTTSRPKIVPLSQRNLCVSAGNIAESLALAPDDVCLNIMPLFHIHGLVAAVMATLAAGAEICCTPGFNALKFFAWMDGAKPTWVTAVPTMYQAILARAGKNAESLTNSRLRLLRSSSASLPPTVMQELEETFHCPVVEAYGMTEAAHQMAVNPLPPAARKPGSVGLPAGPEIAVMDDRGRLQPAGTPGEIVIRGANVTAGYRNNAQANAEAFTNGWFRTGDEGVFDRGGYLRITGRLKEIINRGGECVSPREVDEVLMDHPAIAQAVTFALPHEKLGEEVAAAVVLNGGKGADAVEIRKFAAEHLAPYKVPRKIVILDEIPKGATGKLQRIGLAQKLGLAP